ncbi:MAG: 7-carboxy-7-deazaguanine synthase QueE [Bacteroidales bacterium]|nr:7-carboxy-7-deazaguanine synthase QueE [Bacteroidales bacterium]
MNQSDLLNSGRLLPVMEEFYSLQGEGYHTGEAAWFIRIGGCDVGCSWCDIKESWNAKLFPPVQTDLVIERAFQSGTRAVIITGGEPLLYNLDYLCERLKAQGPEHRGQDKTPKSSKGDLLLPLHGRVVEGSSSDPVIQSYSDPVIQSSSHPASGIRTFLETSGSRPLSGSWDWICLSPKKEWSPREEFYTLSHELKVIIHEETDFTWAEEQAEKMNPDAHLFLQPEWSRREEMLPRIIRYILDHPVWKLSLQAHKYIGIP